MKHTISSREQQVLNLTAHEHTSKEITSKLHIHDYTISDHRKSLMNKPDVRNVAGMLRKGFELGLLTTLILVFNFINVDIIFAQGTNQEFADQTTVSYDNCTGIAKVKFPVRQDFSICGQADNLRHITIWDHNITNGFAAVYTITKDYVTGTFCSTPDDGQFTILGCLTYDKCNFGGTATMQIVNGTGAQRFAEITIPSLDSDAFGGDIEFGFEGWYDYECCENTTNPSSYHGYKIDFSKKWDNGQLSATIDNNTPTISSVTAGNCNVATVNWNNQSNPGGCSGANWTTEIWRSVQNANSWIKVGEKKFSPFTDNNQTFMMTAGVTYEYRLRPRWNVGLRTDYGNNSGSIPVTIPLPDGQISGKVKTLAGNGVPGVLINATLTNPEDLGGCPNISAPPGGYTITTGSDGTYTIQNVYYGIAEDPNAIYRVEGLLVGHDIDPIFEVILNDSNPGLSNIKQNVDLTDSTAITLTGLVTDGVCPIGDVDVFGFSTNPMSNFPIVPVKTDAQGQYQISLPGPGGYNIQVKYRDHEETKTTNVDLNPDDLNFVYPDLSMLSGYVYAGCQEFIGTTQVQALSNGCVIATTNTNNSGYYEMDLPERDVDIIVGPFNPIPSSGISGSLGANESLSIESDTSLNFIFRKPISLEVNGIPAPYCSDIPYPILEQREGYTLEFMVTEGNNCPADTGFVMITDFIGATDQISQIDTIVPIQNGYAYYNLIAGDPNVLAPHMKGITFVAHVGDQNSAQQTETAIVTGAVKRGNTFATTSPQIPYIILRDPPGDGSYAFLEENQTITLTQSFSTELGGGVNVWTKARAGIDIFSLEVWGEVGAELEISGSTTTSDDFVLEIQSMQRFETSDDQNVVGPRGDVFVGAAINLIYAKADILEFDLNACALNRDTEIMVDNDGFETEFVYTDGHIRNTVIPNLQDLYDNAEPTDTMTRFESKRSIKVWQQVLDMNDELKAEAFMQDSIENVSFNSGDGAITRTYTESSTQTRTIEFETIIDATIAVEAGFEIAGSGVSGGVEVNFSTEIGGIESSSFTTSTTTGYVFDDDDNSENGTSKDDTWSVDVVTDPVYGTPVFKLRAGETSCPWEEGTAKRFKPRLAVTNPIIYANPGVDEVTFQFQLFNESETDEAGNYSLELVNASNLGATVTLNNANLTSNVIDFHPLSKGTIFRNVKVKRDLGSQDYAYEGLEFLFYPTCARDEAVSVKISAFFDNPCSDITLNTPNNDWVVNDGDNNLKTINIRDYDLNSNFSEVRLEYALDGANAWNPTNIILAKNQLSNSPNGTNINWNTSSLDDGEYDIRLRLQCNSTFNFSERKVGIIDRSPPKVYGVEQPIDDDYRDGDEIAVFLDEEIQCNQLSNANVTLMMTPQNTVVPAQLLCDGQKITVLPISDISVMLTQRFEVQITGVQDLYENTITAPLIWAFNVGDPDSDMDGISDSQDRCPGGDDFIDTDLGGVPDDCDCNINSIVDENIDDIDCDGFSNSEDFCPSINDASLWFDDMDDYVSRSHSSFNNIVDSDFAFQAWVYPKTGVGDNTIVSEGHGGNGFTDFIYTIGADQKQALMLSPNSMIEWRRSNSVVPFDEWSHVAVSFDWGTKMATFYLNGEPDGQFSYTETDTYFNSSVDEPIYIGRQGKICNCNYFDGKLDDVMIWDRQITAAEILNTMAAPIASPPSEIGMLALFDFNDEVACGTNGATLAINSHNNINFTLFNFDLDGTCESNWALGRNLDSDGDGIGDSCDTEYNGCPPNFANGNSLTGSENSIISYVADGLIQSTQTIQNGANVEYNAGTAIELDESFEVKAGAIFHAFIEGCGS